MGSFRELYEASVADLRRDVDKARKLRSKPIATKFIDVGKEWTVTLHSTSITTPGVDYFTQKIRPKKRIRTENMTLKKLREIFNGDVVLECDCPDFLYGGFRYMGSEDGYVLGKREKRFPEVKNPRLKGSVCKHTSNALDVIKANLPAILKRWRVKYES